MGARGKQPVVAVNVSEVEALLVRIEPLLSPGDFAHLSALANTVLTLTREIRQRGATIARLRRMLGQTSSEKTANVLGKDKDKDKDKDKPSADSSQDATANGDGGTPPPAAAAAPAPQAEGEAGVAPEPTADEPPAKGHGRLAAAAYEVAETLAVPHPTLHRGDACPGCSRGKLHGLPHPARVTRLFGQAPLIAVVWDCDRLRCCACGDVYTAPPPQQARGPKYSESAVSMMAILHYGSGMPLHRLARLQKNLQTPLPSSTQYQIVAERLAVFHPVYDEMLGAAADVDLLHNDDTYSTVLDLKGKRRAKLVADGKLSDPERTGIFTTGIVAVAKTGPIALFLTGRKHAGENLKDLLDERDGRLPPPVQMSDALSRNLPEGHQVVESNCLAHGRRYIVDEVENFPDLCGHVLKELGKVFGIEKQCKKRGIQAAERMLLHQKESEPVMTELESWMKKQLEDKHVEPNSGLGVAFNYMLKRWEKLTAFLRVPNAPLENNICERALKRAIIYRNNSLFYRSLRGAHVGDVYMALIYTAELHGLNPFEYLTDLQLHEKEVAENPSDWLPWTYAATLERIAGESTRAA